LTDIVSDRSVTASPKVESKVVMNSESQVRTEQINTNVKELNHVAKAQKQMSSQETVGVLPQE
jgi:hypothetical protein